MRIISDFHDYYDGVQRYGQADDLIYVRKREQVELKATLPKVERNWSRHPYECTADFVGFCGTVFGYLELSTWVPSRNASVSAICWSLEDADKFCEENLKKKELEEYRNADRWSLTVNRRKIEDFFNPSRQEVRQLWLSLAKTPIFATKKVSNTRWIEHDARLADVEFYRVLDAYQAFQRLQQYLSNEAKTEKPIPHIDDRTMAEAKGFNRWSFRKEPSRR